MSLIDKTYFVNEINLPASDYSDLDAYISRYEKEILQKLLGYELWKLVNEYNETTSPQPIKDLVTGKEFVSAGHTIKWNGLINDDKISLIAYYVYYWYVRNKQISFQNTGMRQMQDENSIAASPVLTITGAWSRLEELYGYSWQNSLIPSAYNYLSANSSDYPEWVFSELGNVNGFDL